MLTPHQRLRLTWLLYEMFGAFEFLFHAAQTRSVPAEVWTRWSTAMKWWLSFRGVQQWWDARPIPFTESFTSYIDEIIVTAPSDADATKKWREFVAGGGQQNDISA